MTRETRDTGFMLVLIFWTVAPHLLRISPWLAALCVAVLAWRGVLAWRQAPLPGRWSLVAVLLAAALLTWFSERTLLGKDAGVTLLVVLMALKTLELRARRDALVVFFLGFFLILTQFLYSQSILTAAGMMVAVWGWLTALTLAHMPSGHPRLREAGWRAARAAAIGTPVMVLLFLLFPRIGPLWSLPNDSSRTGLSDRVELGQMAELAQDDSVAMRIRFLGPTPEPKQMYFRGPVLTQYDGVRWRAEPWLPRHWNHRKRWEPQAEARDTAPAFAYEVTMEPLRIHWLPLLEFAVDPPTAASLNELLLPPQDDSLQWRMTQALGERVRFRGASQPQLARGAEITPTQRDELTRLPAHAHPRTRAWARSLRDTLPAGPQGQVRFVEAVLRHIREERYTYTLSPGRYGGDTLDEFWLDRRLGFCEHYASAFVFILRTAGIPARLVTGYQGSDPDPVDGYVIVRQSHAHAWAEYWQAGQGWVRADPTAAVAPERIVRSQQLQLPAGLMLGTLDQVSPGLRESLRRWTELMDNRWNQWVLGYGRQQQFQMLEFWNIQSSDWVELLRRLAALAATLALLGAGWAWWDGRRRSPWTRLSDNIRGELARVGLATGAHESPGMWSRRLAARWGDSAALASAALLDLERLRYGPPSGTGREEFRRWWPAFRRHMRQLRRQTGPPPG